MQEKEGLTVTATGILYLRKYRLTGIMCVYCELNLSGDGIGNGDSNGEIGDGNDCQDGDHNGGDGNSGDCDGYENAKKNVTVIATEL
uniref:Uncharacterized protein n=1 Tax=Amphimedon queenslandica TaxID=400682 RepID=A0A1X7VHU5_AMPQE